MKKILIAALLLISVSFGAMAQNNEVINQRTMASFKNNFVNASDAVWEQDVNYSKVTFSLNGSILFAYYMPGGEMIAVGRNISSSQLPLHLFTELKKEYNSFWITDLFELSVNGRAEYYITLENADEKRILVANGSNWETHNTIYKKN